MENASVQSADVKLGSDEPELAEMMWASFGEKFEAKNGQKIFSFQCFHTGTTTSVRKSAIRTTKNENTALIMEADSGEVVVAISKAEGCDEGKVLDPNFIGWVRRYEGPIQGGTWHDIDGDVDGFLWDISGQEADDHTDTAYIELDEETLKSHWKWKELVMRSRKNNKGEWSYVYTTQVEGEDYTLLNKGARFLQTGLLETWNPPRAKSVGLDQKVDVRWMWFHDNALHFCDQNNEEYSIRYGEPICCRHTDEEVPEPLWMDKNGLSEPFSNRYLPSGFVEHIAGRRYFVLPVAGVKCRDEDKLEETWQNCSDIDQVTETGALDKLTVSWRQGRWISKLVLDRRLDDGLWSIIHAESSTRDNVDQLSAAVGINCGEKTWLWFYVSPQKDRGWRSYQWWKCPWQIIEILEGHIKGRRRRWREGELVREVGNQSIVNYEREIGELVREVEDQPTTNQDQEDGQATRRYLCWICGERPFNARNQLVAHIEGDGGGGKSHLKMRKRWIEAGRPEREDWLEMLEQQKADGGALFTDATTSPGQVSRAGAQADAEVEAKKVEKVREPADVDGDEIGSSLHSLNCRPQQQCGECNAPPSPPYAIFQWLWDQRAIHYFSQGAGRDTESEVLYDDVSTRKQVTTVSKMSTRPRDDLWSGWGGPQWQYQ